jgi:very-short-patch-repair endonuclease
MRVNFLSNDKLHRIKPSFTVFARESRKNPTHTEDILWQMLRNRKIGGLKFRREAQVEGFIADFYCAEHKLIVEIDGDIHELEDVKKRDVFRQDILEKAGYKVIRFSSDDVFVRMDWVIDQIVKYCH